MILFFLAALAHQLAAATSPRGFIAQVYADYRHPNYNPLDRLDRTFAPELAAAIREDARLAKGEVGYLDGDPLCDCQDFLKVTATIRSLTQPIARKASARVRVALGVDQPHDLRLELTRTPTGWRIADVVSSQGSLLAGFKKSNREARVRH